MLFFGVPLTVSEEDGLPFTSVPWPQGKGAMLGNSELATSFPKETYHVQFFYHDYKGFQSSRSLPLGLWSCGKGLPFFLSDSFDWKAPGISGADLWEAEGP